MCSTKRDDQGLYECEVWADSREGGARRDLSGAEGSQEWKKCEKNPGHKKFIPAPDFGLEHLPEEYRTPEILELVQAEADLTVRLRVQHTSAARPDGYPFCNYRGRDVPHTGTGVVTFVGLEDHIFTDSEDEDEDFYDEEDDDRDEETRRREFEEYEEENKKPAFSQDDCPCHDCEDARLLCAKENQKQSAISAAEAEKFEGAQQPDVSFAEDSKIDNIAQKQACSSVQEDFPAPDKQRNAQKERPCWLIFVETALHVVYDTAEARRTVVDAFYDTNTASARAHTLFGFCVSQRYEEEDRCTLKCATHNEELVRKLRDAQDRRYELCKHLGQPMVPSVSQAGFKLGLSDKENTGVSEKENRGFLDKEKTSVYDKDIMNFSDKEKTGVSDNEKIGVSDNGKTGFSDKEKPNFSAVKKTNLSDKEKASFYDTENTGVSDKVKPEVSPESCRVAIVIGHPHGRSKTICVGQWTDRVKNCVKKAATLTHYIYDTATCKGNSGGAVMTFGKVEDERVTVAILTHHHRSASSIPGFNMSSPSYEYTREIFTLK